MKSQLVGQWGLYPWFEESGRKLVHPDDLESFRSLGPYCKVFECVAEDVTHIALSYGESSFRVTPELFRPVPPPMKRVGDEVVLKGDHRKGKIVKMMWHFDKEQPMYFLVVDGKKKSKRYWESDFAS